ncbi:hypothetical protein BTURTLESOX_345 [bacterium endosymbiont of Bathymodiolus sp. 5 South]|nr:hypothetical protein BTURTLESOX_345 [bacterium endosymbiont of Bathymodiolus sp. 5 South]
MVVGDFRDCLLAWTGAEESPCSIVIFCCEEAGVLDASATAVSSSLLIEISFDCSDSLSVGGPLWLVVFGLFP